MKFLTIIKNLILAGIAFAVMFGLIYLIFLRPWLSHAGTTKEEAKMSLPGDGLVAGANNRRTQAVTVNTSREYVWAYIIQMGYKRAGWYNLDFINRLADKNYFYENNKSADRIIPELQGLKKGDNISIVAALPPFVVTELKEKEYMLMKGEDAEGCHVTWLYQLKEIDKNKTRLYVRWISRDDTSFATKVFNASGASEIQQLFNIKGIKKRAEIEFQKGTK